MKNPAFEYMSYTETVNTVFYIMAVIAELLFTHYAVLAAVGVFACKKFPKAERKNKYALIIPAKNEEAVIYTLIQSVRSTDYPQELLDIFVVAHNCSDRTAEIVAKTDAHVYESSYLTLRLSFQRIWYGRRSRTPEDRVRADLTGGSYG